MKGRTICPKCNHEFILDIPKDSKKYKAICPKCNCTFDIKKTSDDIKTEDECYWEEHGEPRKTILSSIRPRTDKPMIAALILIIVFLLGASSAAFTENFIDSPLDLLSYIGLTGSADFIIIDQSNNNIENVSILINGISGKTNLDGRYFTENIPLGISRAEINISQNMIIVKEILILPFINSYNEIIIDENNERYIPYEMVSCSIILLIFSVIALIGGLASLIRQHFDVAIAGSILGIFSFGFFFIGSILSIIALIIILYSKEEFENGKKGKSF